MKTTVEAVVGVLVCAGLLLFLGGMASAYMEIRAEKRAGVPVTRPGWQRVHRVPRTVTVTEKALLAVGLGGIAQRLNDRRFSRVSR